MYVHVRNLYEQELWSSVAQLAPMALADADNALRKQNIGIPMTAVAAAAQPASAASCWSSRQRVHVQLMLADALSRIGEPRRAEAIYRDALDAFKVYILIIS